MTKKQIFPVLILSLFISSSLLSACNQEISTEKKTNNMNDSKNVTPSKEVPWKRWTPEAFAQAKQTNRLVLVDFSAEWCTFCKKMDKTTWRDPQVLAIIGKNYIPVRVEDEVDTELAEKYRSYGRPAIVVLDADGKEIFKKTGYLKPQWMLWTLQGVLQDKD
jgi:uncharacterized protein YyaL (SSP411 family)